MRVAAELSGLTFSVLASILWPANMDFSSKCIGKALGGKTKKELKYSNIHLQNELKLSVKRCSAFF